MLGRVVGSIPGNLDGFCQVYMAGACHFKWNPKCETAYSTEPVRRSGKFPLVLFMGEHQQILSTTSPGMASNNERHQLLRLTITKHSVFFCGGRYG